MQGSNYFPPLNLYSVTASPSPSLGEILEHVYFPPTTDVAETSDRF